MTTGRFAVDFVLLLLFNLLVWSFVEWWVHRTVMHRRRLAGVVYRLWPYVETAYRNHAVLHHHVYYRVYDDEPDERGRELNLRFHVHDNLAANLLLAPLHALYLQVNPLGSLVLVLLITGYMFAWNTLHVEMHIPTNRWLFRHPVFRFLNRHHYLHHVHPRRNFNVVLPLADYLLGTVARPTPADRSAMARYGLYGNRRGRDARPVRVTPGGSPSLTGSIA
jgi:Fatty acid hydroxylase superfamily